jgi:hypothetical protein
MFGNSGVAAQPAASHEGPRSMELVIINYLLYAATMINLKILQARLSSETDAVF